MAVRTNIIGKSPPPPNYAPDTVPTGAILTSTPVETVFINSARAVVVGAVASDKSVVLQGSRNVFFEGIPATRYGDMTTVGTIKSASDDVFVNNR